MRKLILIVVIILFFLGGLNAFSKYPLGIFSNLQKQSILKEVNQKVKLVTEESVVINTVKKVEPSVVTVVEESSGISNGQYDFGPFSIFGTPNNSDNKPQGIGSGFIVSKDGLIITNKHVVSDIGAKYQIAISNDKKYKVEKIFRDPLNDVAILQINKSEHPEQELKPIALGNSSNLQVGQFVIAIGTALGEFKSTVTTGVISGLGRGINAGNMFQGYVERLDNVIQTDAAINPGNSGGPLLNSSSEVIGVNTAIASGGQNIGFALPINIIKESLDNFNKHGQFNRPFLGVSYKILDKQVALLNNVPEGVYVQDVVVSSPAEKAGINRGDIIISINAERLEKGKKELADIISSKKVGDMLSITLWREGKILDIKAVLGSTANQ